MPSTSQDSTRADECRVTAVGARRRLQALVAIGYSQTDLAEQLHLHRGTLAHWCYDVPPHKWRAVAALFTRLQLVPGTSQRARAHARKRGWPPPLAWDEETIDDETATPVGIPPKNYRQWNRIPEDFVELVLDAREHGKSDVEIAASMGIKLNAFGKRLNRAGLPERRHAWTGPQRCRDHSGRFLP